MVLTTLGKSVEYKNNAFVVKLVYTADLKSAGESHAGSSPARRTKYRKLAQLVEHLPYTQAVIGSKPVLPTR